MKKIILPLVIALISFSTVNAQLSDADRDAAVTEMTETHNALMASVEGLSEAQLNFKATPESWSIAECVEHIAISENAIFSMLDGALQTEADPTKRSEVKMTDTQLLGVITDRSGKVKTSEAFEPSGKFGSYEETLAAFVTKRKENLTFIGESNDDLRNRYAQTPFGTVDGLQVVFFMSGHTNRHTQQIEEVKANEGFPTE